MIFKERKNWFREVLGGMNPGCSIWGALLLILLLTATRASAAPDQATLSQVENSLRNRSGRQPDLTDVRLDMPHMSFNPNGHIKHLVAPPDHHYLPSQQSVYVVKTFRTLSALS
jgi:hypothetical protein